MTDEGTGFVHDALYYGSDEQLLETAVPFLRAGIDAGETVLVVCTDGSAALLNEALDRDARVVFLPQDEIYRNASRTIRTYQRFVEGEIAAGVRGVRLVGEVAFGACPAATRLRRPLRRLYGSDGGWRARGRRDGPLGRPSALRPDGPIPNARRLHRSRGHRGGTRRLTRHAGSASKCALHGDTVASQMTPSRERGTPWPTRTRAVPRARRRRPASR